MYVKNEMVSLVCKCCGKQYFNNYKRSKFCSKPCRQDYWNNKSVQYQNMATSEISRGTVGAISELMVCNDLMLKGYAVYKAVSPNTFADIVAIKKDKIYQIEVRTGRYSRVDTLIYPMKNIKGKSLAIYTYKDSKIHYLTNPELNKNGA